MSLRGRPAVPQFTSEIRAQPNSAGHIYLVADRKHLPHEGQNPSLRHQIEIQIRASVPRIDYSNSCQSEF
jgi:hypothetical protein